MRKLEIEKFDLAGGRSLLQLDDVEALAQTNDFLAERASTECRRCQLKRSWLIAQTKLSLSPTRKAKDGLVRPKELLHLGDLQWSRLGKRGDLGIFGYETTIGLSEVLVDASNSARNAWRASGSTVSRRPRRELLCRSPASVATGLAPAEPAVPRRPRRPQTGLAVCEMATAAVDCVAAGPPRRRLGIVDKHELVAPPSRQAAVAREAEPPGETTVRCRR